MIVKLQHSRGVTAYLEVRIILCRPTPTPCLKQVALLWQRDRATRLSVEILQLQNIPFEN